MSDFVQYILNNNYLIYLMKQCKVHNHEMIVRLLQTFRRELADIYSSDTPQRGTDIRGFSPH